MIPNIFHVIWFGSAKHPREMEYQRNLKSLQMNHPTWKIMYWTNTSDPVFVNNVPISLESIESPYIASDLARLAVLNVFGGVYVDSDIFCLNPLGDEVLEPNMMNVSNLAGRYRANNCLMACSKGHVVISDIINEGFKRYSVYQKRGWVKGGYSEKKYGSVPFIWGPRVVNEITSNKPTLFNILPREVIYDHHDPEGLPKKCIFFHRSMIGWRNTKYKKFDRI